MSGSESFQLADYIRCREFVGLPSGKVLMTNVFLRDLDEHWHSDVRRVVNAFAVKCRSTSSIHVGLPPATLQWVLNRIAKCVGKPRDGELVASVQQLIEAVDVANQLLPHMQGYVATSIGLCLERVA